MFKIYHIKGVKIGCTTQPIERVKEQGFNTFEILEEHTDIYVASNREQELQKQYGYRIDECPYWKSYEQNMERRSKLTKEKLIKAGKDSGNKNVESGWIKEFQERSVKARTGSKHSDETKMKIKSKAIGNNNKPTIAILVFDKLNNLIGEYKSIISAANELNLHQGNICKVLKGELLTTGGYKIKYK